MFILQNILESLYQHWMCVCVWRGKTNGQCLKFLILFIPERWSLHLNFLLIPQWTSIMFILIEVYKYVYVFIVYKIHVYTFHIKKRRYRKTLISGRVCWKKTCKMRQTLFIKSLILPFSNSQNLDLKQQLTFELFIQMGIYKNSDTISVGYSIEPLARHLCSNKGAVITLLENNNIPVFFYAGTCTDVILWLRAKDADWGAGPQCEDAGVLGLRAPRSWQHLLAWPPSASTTLLPLSAPWASLSCFASSLLCTMMVTTLVRMNGHPFSFGWKGGLCSHPFS